MFFTINLFCSQGFKTHFIENLSPNFTTKNFITIKFFVDK